MAAYWRGRLENLTFGVRFVRCSNGIDFKERIKIMKLLWASIGTEFGGPPRTL